jgi:glycogen synthase
MKILMISDLFPPCYVGGYETVCHEVAEGLMLIGHEVRVVTSNYQRSSGGEGPTLRRTLTYRNGSRHRGLWRDLALEVRDNYELRRVLRDHRPDVVHVWNMSGLGKSLLETIRRSRIPMAFAIHDRWLEHVLPADPWLARWRGDSKRSLRWLSTLHVRDLIGRLAPVAWEVPQFRMAAFVSRYNLFLFRSAGFTAEVAEVIPNGVSIPPTYSAARVDGRRKLLYAGQLHAQKGVHHAVRALSTLVRQGRSDFHLTIVGTNAGSSSYPRSLATLVADLGISAQVRFTGHLPRARVFEMMRENDMLLFTSDEELGCPLVVSEAFAMGLPVVGTTVGGAAEIMENEKTCLTFERGDEDALAACIRRLADDEDLACAISHRARRFAEERLSLAAMVRSYESQLIRAAST